MKESQRQDMLKRQRERQRKKSYGIQFNMQRGGEMYAPSRDFAHNYPRMIDSVIQCFSQDYWPELYEQFVVMYAVRTTGRVPDKDEDSLAELSNLAFSELEKAKDAYCKFLNESYKDPDECCDDVLQRVGWLDLPVEAQTTWLAMLGQVMTGQLFAGVRDIYMGTGQPLPTDVSVFLEHGHDARRAMNKIDKTVEVRRDSAKAFREAIRAARSQGFSFDEISELVEDVRHGRVPASA